jgi:hypothetical protein
MGDRYGQLGFEDLIEGGFDGGEILGAKSS